MDDETRQVIAEIGATANKLYQETLRLRRDVMSLRNRIEPYEGVCDVPEPILEDFKHRNLKEMLDTLAAAKATILGCERDISAIRGVMDGIASDAISREEMKPYIIDRSRLKSDQ